jgi:large subunit ribosomal protein L6
MSRIGNKPIVLPKGVEVTIANGIVRVKGPKGTLEQRLHPGIAVAVEGDQVVVSAEDLPGIAKFHGLMRALIGNMIIGVSEGFEKRLEMIGVGFRAAVKGNTLELLVGYSNPVELGIPEGLAVKVEKNTLLSVSGADRQLVGQFAADIRAKRPPEPYKGKGIRGVGEYVRRKAGKAAK